ncbi:MAG: spermidine synthase, partial [Planctomycetes bacterium]|nr:spermidine synthase [Planctomycetota bacterium]
MAPPRTAAGARPAPGARPPVAPAALLFLLSGAAGLLYEVVWSRQLARPLGGTWPALVAVVAAFLGGLALGAFLGGRFAGRVRRPLRAYAILEAGIGLWCLAFPLLLEALHPVFGACYRGLSDRPLPLALSRFGLAALLLAPPTIAMGATLPLLLRAVVREEGRSVLSGTGLLYGINTVGAAGGAAVTGLLLLPALGFRGTTAVGAAAN